MVLETVTLTNLIVLVLLSLLSGYTLGWATKHMDLSAQLSRLPSSIRTEYYDHLVRMVANRAELYESKHIREDD